jgi:hypothetical protein
MIAIFNPGLGLAVTIFGTLALVATNVTTNFREQVNKARDMLGKSELNGLESWSAPLSDALLKAIGKESIESTDIKKAADMLVDEYSNAMDEMSQLSKEKGLLKSDSKAYKVTVSQIASLKSTMGEYERFILDSDNKQAISAIKKLKIVLENNMDAQELLNSQVESEREKVEAQNEYNLAQAEQYAQMFSNSLQSQKDTDALIKRLEDFANAATTYIGKGVAVTFENLNTQLTDIQTAFLDFQTQLTAWASKPETKTIYINYVTYGSSGAGNGVSYPPSSPKSKVGSVTGPNYSNPSEFIDTGKVSKPI